jgi:hypothetical protein
MEGYLKRADLKEIKSKVQQDYCLGLTPKELAEKYDRPVTTVRRWCHNKQVEKPPVIEVDDELRVDQLRDVTVSSGDTVEGFKTRGLAPGSPVFKAKTLELAEKKYGAGLDFQLAQAVWLVNCRYPLIIETTSNNGVTQYHKIPVLSENIDWEAKVVHFNDRQYSTSQLAPMSAMAEKGLNLLMKLTGTDQTSTEEVKAHSKSITAQLERDAENQQVSTVSIFMDRPERKSLEDFIKGENGEDNS